MSGVIAIAMLSPRLASCVYHVGSLAVRADRDRRRGAPDPYRSSRRVANSSDGRDGRPVGVGHLQSDPPRGALTTCWSYLAHFRFRLRAIAASRVSTDKLNGETQTVTAGGRRTHRLRPDYPAACGQAAMSSAYSVRA